MNLLQLQAELARKPLPHQYNEYSAKEKVDISKYSADVLRFSCLLHRLDNEEVFTVQHVHINYSKLQI